MSSFRPSLLLLGVAIAVFAFVASSLALPNAATAQLFQESKIRGYDYKGAYGQFGASVGEINFDDSSSDASGGFTMTGGYRFLPWLSAEANFTYLGGGDVEVGNFDAGEGEFFAFTFGPKVYPLGLLKVEEIPHFVQPYALIGIGGGEFDIDGPAGVHDESAFVARFLLGFDVWATDHIGFFVEGGGHAASEDDVEGVGLFTVGGQYRF
ncbi:porin family protein [Myxococcota bacterium]|nr:porin family protein [Myxococcota bacterium]